MRARIAFPLLAAFAAATIAAAAADEPRLLVASNAVYETSVELLATPELTSTRTIDFSKCVLGPSGARVKIVPSGGDILRGLGSAACIGGEFFMINLPPEDVAAKTIIHYRSTDGAESSSYTIGPIGAISGDEVIRVGLLASDDDEGAWINVLPEVDGTPIMVTLHDATSAAGPDQVELFTARRPITQYRIAARGRFFASVQLGNGLPAPYGCWTNSGGIWVPKDCADYGDVYGVVTTGAPNSSPRVIEFPIK